MRRLPIVLLLSVFVLAPAAADTQTDAEDRAAELERLDALRDRLEREPADRYQSAADLADDLSLFLRENAD